MKAESFFEKKVPVQNIEKDRGSAYLKKIKIFGVKNERNWHNRIVRGDNLQILKILLELKKERVLRNKDGSPGIRLIYIDPPFGTGDIYSRNGVNVYSAKLSGLEYLEWLRIRILLMKELLSEDGSIYIRSDYHHGHYLKVILDEIFGMKHFRNEIIINRTKKVFDGIQRFSTATDSLFFYTKSDDFLFHGVKKVRREKRWIPMHSPGIRWTKIKPDYFHYYQSDDIKEEGGKFYSRGRVIWGKPFFPPEGRHWTFSQQRLEQYLHEGRIRLNKKSRMLEYLTSDSEIVDSNWTDIPGYSFKWNYPTENSEPLLERIIAASSNPGDIILDSFAGSGTTGAVAEKMKRRWIMLDSSRTSAFTMLKRILSLREEIGNKGKPLNPGSFSTYNTFIGKNMSPFLLSLPNDYIGDSGIPFDCYRQLALFLFHCDQESFFLNGVKIDGCRSGDPVKIFDWRSEENLTISEEYVYNLHESLGHLSKERFIVIAPSSLFTFFHDSIILNNKEFLFLKIPDSILKKLTENRNRWQRLKGEIDYSCISDLVAMDFDSPPTVKCLYTIKSDKKKTGKIAIIKIIDFKSHVFSNKPLSEDKTDIQVLSLVSIDYNYNGKFFKIMDTWQIDDLSKQCYEIRFPLEKLNKNMMVIYSDIFGNEKKEVVSSDCFI